MPANPERRNQLADAGLRVLTANGSRGLTFRAVDAEAGVPTGTASNYYRNRDEMFADLARRIFERLAPEPEFLSRQAAQPATLETFTVYIQDIYRRIAANRDLFIALLELRLEGTRRPEFGAHITEMLQRNFAANVEFNRQAGLPGGPAEITLLIYAMDGLFIDRLTPGMTTEFPDPYDAVETLVQRLMRE